MSRETIVGFVTALGLYLKLDEKALYKDWEEKARWMAEQLGDIPGVETGLAYHATVEENEPMAPLCYVTIDEEVFGMTGRELSKRLRDGTPSIEAPYEAGYLGHHPRKLTLNPEFMLDGEESLVVQRIREILTRARRPDTQKSDLTL